MYYFHSAEDFLLANAFLNQIKTTAAQRNTLRDSAELSPINAECANRGLRIFPVSQTSKYAASLLIKARIGGATSDLAALQEFAAEDPAPAGYAFVTVPDPGVFATEMDGERRIDAFNGLVALAIISLQGDEADWQTLSARAGQSTFAIYQYPAGMTLRRSGDLLEEGITIHGDGGYVMLPSDFAFLDPDQSIAPGPQLLLDLAFMKVPIEISTWLAHRIAPQMAESCFMPSSSKPDAGKQIWGVLRKESPVRGSTGWRGKIRISRRRGPVCVTQLFTPGEGRRILAASPFFLRAKAYNGWTRCRDSRLTTSLSGRGHEPMNNKTLDLMMGQIDALTSAVSGRRSSPAEFQKVRKHCSGCKGPLPPPHTPGSKYCILCSPAKINRVYMSFTQRGDGWFCSFQGVGSEDANSEAVVVPKRCKNIRDEQPGSCPYQ